MNVNAKLIAHCDTKRTTEAEVRAEPMPDFTATWHPYSHAAVLDAVGAAVADAGFTIERREYSMSPNDKMFGVWEINKSNADIRFAIGIRNSIAKSLAVGLCAGERVFVCDNMVFSSEYILFRKHTGMLDGDELTMMAREAVASVIPNWSRIQAWHDRMKSFELDIRTESMITVAAMRRGIIPPAQFDRWTDLYHGNGVPAKYTPTLHGWHGATTELMNGLALYRNAARQTVLNSFIDHAVPIIIDAAVTTKSVSFTEIETDAAERERAARRSTKIAAREMRATFRAKVIEHRRNVRAVESGRRRRGPVAETVIGETTTIPLNDRAKAIIDVCHGEHGGAQPETDRQFADRTGMTDIANEIERRRRVTRTAQTAIKKSSPTAKQIADAKTANDAFNKQLKAAGRRMNVITVPGIGPVGFTTPDPTAKPKRIRSTK